MTDVQVYNKRITEKVVEGKRLGRHISHDPRSWRYPAPMADKITTVHHSIGILLDQGELGSCTGNAMTYMLSSDKFVDHTKTIDSDRDLNEEDAVAFYSEATRLDHYRGVYPPNDTGSNGLAVCKAAKEKSYIGGYAHCFSLEHALRTLVIQPTIGGFNWKGGMDHPDNDGIVHYTGSIRGGHEFVACGIKIEDANHILDSPNNLIEFKQSWGEFGVDLPGEGTGYFYMPIPEYGQMMHDQGDVKTGILL